MTKSRTPDTLEAALEMAIGFVGVERVGQMIGKSAAMVRNYADTDKDHALHWRSADAIDRQLALAGFPQPFAELTAFRAARHARAAEQLASGLAEDLPVERPLKLAAKMACEAADLVARIDSAEADGAYSAGEIEALCKHVGTLSQRAGQLKRSVAARRRVRK